jgi:hypothetical protein
MQVQSERSDGRSQVEQVDEVRICPTCDRDETEADFYAVGTECRDCKRARSRRNRRETARKLAIAERLIDGLLIHLAGEPAYPGRRGAQAAKRGRAAIPAPVSPSTSLLVTQEMQP